MDHTITVIFLKSRKNLLKVLIEVETSILQTKFELRYLDSDAPTLSQDKMKYFFDNVPPTGSF